MNTFDSLASSSHESQPDILGPVHKAIRRLLADLLVRLGQADYDDADAVLSLGRALEDTLKYCERHIEHEEKVVRPACEGLLVPEAFDSGHPRHLEMIAELRSLGRALAGASARHRAAIGHTLYLHFSVFVADNLHHMAEEERVLLPLLRSALGDKVLLALHTRIVGSMAPDELASSARAILCAVTPTERKALALGMLRQAPRATVMALLESAKTGIGESAFSDLVRTVESAPVAQ